ncbi:sulfatase-like hydrolase/transferase [Nocardioides sp. GXZ039]|uniref:sulfatase-like hydrolase/transferase n=1 Tax=Nocardioides sp. GXZ039 TaxID=3136018 RepID=UPI0030F3C232
MALATLVIVVVLAVGMLAANVVSKRHDAEAAPAPGTGAGASPSASDAPSIPAVDPGDGTAGTTTAQNAIVFLVDDMHDFSCEEADLYLPRSSPWLREHGTCYENATTSTPVCCPARAQLQTGQYSHNNRVISQKAAHRLTVRDTVQHDLGQARIATYGIGKNLNGVRPSSYYGRHPLSTGFQRFNFWNSYKGRPGKFQLYEDDGTRYRPRDGLTSTETSGRYLNAYLDEKLASGERFFIYNATFAPHKQGARFAPRHMPPVAREHRDDPVPPFRYSPERDARDKLPIFRRAHQSRAYYEGLFAARARSLRSVDDQIAETFQRLQDAGVLDRTAVFFVSDNGYTDQGEVNWEGKSIPYPAAMNVPLLAYYPGRAAAVDTRDVNLVDVTATLYDVLDVAPGHLLDGHSLLGDHDRKVVYGEFYAESNGLVRQESGRRTTNLRSWRMVRRDGLSYVEWYGKNGGIIFREFYADPGMTRNLLFHRRDPEAPTKATVLEFKRLLHRYGTCQGTVEQGTPHPCS